MVWSRNYGEFSCNQLLESRKTPITRKRFPGRAELISGVIDTCICSRNTGHYIAQTDVYPATHASLC